MDFITKQSDLKHTEILYGKNSDQYALHNILINAENILRNSGKLELGKMCKREFIIIHFRTNIFNSNMVAVRIKFYCSIDGSEVRRIKEQTIAKSVSDLIYDDVYKLIVNDKYKVITEEE